jgi:hypothetical protein
VGGAADAACITAAKLLLLLLVTSVWHGLDRFMGYNGHDTSPGHVHCPSTHTAQGVGCSNEGFDAFPCLTSVWLISSSVPLKKWGATSGPIRKVTRLCATGTVKTSPSCA